MPLPKKNLSASAKKIVELIATVANGSQRDFSRIVGCSQPVISRIVNGKQEPGRELLERIAKLDSVDRDSLLATLKAEETITRFNETTVAIATCLLDGSPSTRCDQLTSGTLVLSTAIYRPSLYAVAARACEPAFSDPLEEMLPNDLIVIESSLDGLRKNLFSLNNKLCVVVTRTSRGDVITLRRVFVVLDGDLPRLTICIKVSASDEASTNEPQGRVIHLDEDEPLRTPTRSNQVIELGDIVGVGIELVRIL